MFMKVLEQRAGDMAQVVEHLLASSTPLVLTPVPQKNNKKKGLKRAPQRKGRIRIIFYTGNIL
jgi:hypothetical protein